MEAVLRGRLRRILAAAAVAALLAGGLLLAASAHRAAADASGGGDERCDLIGENHHGPLTVALERTFAFPERGLILTMPGQGSVDPSRMHVFEDCQAVAITVTALSPGRYEVRYRSRRPFGERDVELGVQVDGVDKADIDYTSPAAAAALGTGASHQTFWGSAAAKIVVPASAGLLCALALVLFLVPGRRPDVRARIAEFVPEPESTLKNPSVLAAVARYDRVERFLARTGWWPAFKESAEIARLGRSAVELVMIDTAVTVALAALLGMAGLVPVALLALVLGPLALRSLVRWGVRRQQALFADQLPSHLDEFASALRAGHGLAAGLAASLKSAPEPSRSEWARVVSDEALGTPLDDAMRTLAQRMASDDVEQVALVASLHQRAGGNVAEIIDRVTEGVRERAELRREVRALTAQARMTRWILTVLPFGMIVMISLMSPSYMKPLFTTTGGIVALVIAGVLLMCGSLTLRKLTEIKV
jgi:tight adherence protein B